MIKDKKGDKARLYKGYYKPAGLAAKDKKIDGWHNETADEFPAIFNTTYNDTADVVVKGKTLQKSEWVHKQGLTTQSGTPTPETPIPLNSNLPAGTYKTQDWRGDWYEFTLTEDLCGIGEVRDSVEWDKYSHTGRLTNNLYNGTLDLSTKNFVKTGSAWQRTGCFSAYVSSALPYNGVGFIPGRIDYCDMLQFGSWEWSGRPDPYNYFLCGNNSKLFYFILPLEVIGCVEEDSDATKLAAAKAFFTNNPPTVVYQLATPTSTPLTFTKNNASTAPECPMEFLTDTPSLEYPATVWDASGTVKARGKNLFDTEAFANDSSAHYEYTDGKLKVKSSDNRAWTSLPAMLLRAGEYVWSRDNTVGSITFRISTDDYATQLFWNEGISTYNVTFTEDVYIKMKVATGLTNYPYVYNIQLELGSVATPYEPYRPIVTAPIPALRSNQDETVYDEFEAKTGKVTRRINPWAEITGLRTLTKADSTLLAYKVFKMSLGDLPIPATATTNIIAQKYDSTLLTAVNASPTSADRIYTDGSYFYLSAAMADTGFSEACLPSDDEVKAYFYGWKMCHSDGKSPYYKSEVPYNPETWAEWTKSSNVAADLSGMTITADGTWDGPIVNTNMKTSTKYGLLMNVVSKSITRPLYIGAPTLVVETNYNPSVGNSKLIFTTKTSISYNSLKFSVPSAETIGHTIKLKDIRIYELPTGSQIEADFTNLTADELAIKYPFDGLNVKHWKKLVGTEAEIQNSITPTLPTASYEGFTPYKMIYELAEPIEEQHTPGILPTYYPTTVIEIDNHSPASIEEAEVKVKVQDVWEE